MSTTTLYSADDRLSLIIEMAPRGFRTVDVGCDHGHVAAALGAVGSEREWHRHSSRSDIPRVVANGLAGHSDVELAILTGMGPRLILGILDRGPSPLQAIVHTPQHSHALRAGLAERGWEVVAEGLAPENGRFAEVIHIQFGEPEEFSFELCFGRGLMGHPWAKAHAEQLRKDWSRLANDAPEHTNAHQQAKEWLAWLDQHIPTFSG